LDGLDLGNINMGQGGFVTIERAPGAPGGRGGRWGGRGGGGEKQVLSVRKALERYVEEYEEALMNEEEVIMRAKEKAENCGEGGRERGKEGGREGGKEGGGDMGTWATWGQIV
jgi:hypothetical protein